MPYGQLEVTVVEGKKLKEADIFDKTNPYVTLSLDRQNKQKTRTVQNAGSEATWNDKFTFDVLESRNELFLEVLDEDTGNDELIGGVTIPLDQVFKQGQVNRWVNIARPSGKPAGEIHLSMSFKNQGPTSGPPGHTPYPTPDGSSYFSPPNSSSSTTYQEDQVQQDVFSSMGPEGGAIPLGYGSGAPPLIKPPGKMMFNSMGPEGGAIPLGYGSGTPPPIKPPHSTDPPAYPTAGSGFPDSSSYSMNMPGQAQTYGQQPTSGTPSSDPSSDPSSEQLVKEREQKSEDNDSDLTTTAGISLAAAAGSIAFGVMGDKFKGDYKREHEMEDKDKKDEV